MLSTLHELQDTLTEAKVLAQFNHVNIVHYYECLLEVRKPTAPSSQTYCLTRAL